MHQRKKRLLLVWMLALGLCLPGPLAAAPPWYNYFNLGYIGENMAGALAINQACQIVGFTRGPHPNVRVAFLKNPWQPMEQLGSLGGDYSVANAINAAGWVVGYSYNGPYNAGGIMRAFLQKPGQAMEDLGSFKPPDGAAEATGINAAGQAVGWALNTDGWPRACKWQDGVIVDLGDLGGRESIAFGINEAGQVVGWALNGAVPSEVRPFLKNPGEAAMQDLGSLGGGEGMAYAINHAGQVVGYSRLPGGARRAFLKNPGQAMQDLGTLGGQESVAYGINDSGQVVGWSKDVGDNGRAFFWDRGTMYQPTKYTLSGDNRGINNQGWIVGLSTYPQAWLLTPGSSVGLEILLD